MWKTHRMLRSLTRTVAVCVWIVCSGVISAELPRPQDVEWYAVDQYVVHRLLNEDRAPWVEKLLEGPMSNDPVELMVRLDLMVRDGRQDEAHRTMQAMTPLGDAIPGHTWSAIADEWIDRGDADGLSRDMMEQVPGIRPGWAYVMIKRWAEQAEPTKIDAWLIARIEAERAWYRERTKRDRSGWSPFDIYSSFWFNQWIEFHQHQKTLKPLVEKLAGKVRNTPTDATAASDYVQAAMRLPDDSADIAWLTQTIKLTHATDYDSLARSIDRRRPAVAVTFFERSLAQWFDDDDYQVMLALARFSQVRRPPIANRSNKPFACAPDTIWSRRIRKQVHPTKLRS